MTEFIAEIFSKIFNDNVMLATVLVSMIPLMELKGGIPFGMSGAFWGAGALGRWEAFWWAYLGCSVVAVILYFLFVPIMNLLHKTKLFKGIANYVDGRIKKQSAKIEHEEHGEQAGGVVGEGVNAQTGNASVKKTVYKMLGIFLFVAVPLPLTGVWMGVCISVAIGLKFWQTFIVVELGNLVAGLIISTICVIFPNFTHWLIYIFIILVVLVLIVEIIRNKIKKKNKIK